jgi:diadenosine tetraphosphate (Ap4A) HIT family hydrolase
MNTTATSKMITLHPQLERDCIRIGEFNLCSLLLLDDANYPWFILLPNIESITEIHQLSVPDQHQLLAESSCLSRCLEQVFQPDKINIAALGNIVPQLHIHHIARYQTDASWPAPVWGAVPATRYQQEQIDSLREKVTAWLHAGEGVSFSVTY